MWGRVSKMCDKVYCEECGKLLGYANYETFHKSYKGFISKEHRKLFCNEQCYKQYCDRNKIEDYDNE